MCDGWGIAALRASRSESGATEVAPSSQARISATANARPSVAPYDPRIAGSGCAANATSRSGEPSKLPLSARPSQITPPGSAQQ